jgi:hypothetical protein
LGELSDMPRDAQKAPASQLLRRSKLRSHSEHLALRAHPQR